MKKYKLLKSDPFSDAPKPCTFFKLPGGCRNGDACPFVHDGNGNTSGSKEKSPSKICKKAEMISESSDENEDDNENGALSSSSEEENFEKNSVSSESSAEKPKMKNKKKDSQDKSNTGSKLLQKKEVSIKSKKRPAPEEKITPKTKKAKPGSFVSMAFSDAGNSTEDIMSLVSSPTSTVTPKKSPKKKVEKSQSFRDMKLPVASFTKATQQNEESNPSSSSSEEQEEEEWSKLSSEQLDELTKSNPLIKEWRDLITKTQSHPSFENTYNFTSRKEKEEWVQTQPLPPNKNPKVIAIDCEMAEATNDETKQKDYSALIRFSVVNGENLDDVLIDTLVKPAGRISQYRDFVHGITKDHLKNVKFTLQHAQEFILKLCSSDTIVIGHGLYNDLRSLRVDHKCVVDTAYLYHVKDEEAQEEERKTKRLPSLKDVAMTVLGQEMPDQHDSVNDAKVSFMIADYYRQKDGDVEEIVATARKNSTSNCLFIHRIPKQCQTNHLQTLFTKHTNVVPEKVDTIEWNDKTGKTMVSFKSKQHADLAFSTLVGKAEIETSGRLQKKVYLKDKRYLNVRKMVFERRKSLSKSEDEVQKSDDDELFL